MTVSDRWRTVPPFLPLMAALAGSFAYSPGLVTWDSLRQYGQASRGVFDDWHPPVMEWIWRQMLPLAHSPAPMLVLQLSLYGVGLGLIVATLVRRGGSEGGSEGGGRRHRRVAFWIACCALQPIVIALMATIIKDSLMTGALICAVGLVMIAEQESIGRRSFVAARTGALLLCLFAATLRFNALPATLPVALWAVPPQWRAGLRRATGWALLLALPLLAAMPVANRLIGARHSDVALSLVIFDLGGMTDAAGVDLFPPLGVRDAVAVNHRCYAPAEWDSYSWWTDTLCPINFELVRRAFRDSHRNPWGWWLSAVAHHPIAYLWHRARHWNINTRFIVPDEVQRPVQVQAPPNALGFAVTPNDLVRAVDGAALVSAHTPLGWPCVWMAALAALLWQRRALLVFDPVTILATSALLYGLGYAAASVASELRYYLWTYVAGALAFVLALSQSLYRNAPLAGAANKMRSSAHVEIGSHSDMDARRWGRLAMFPATVALACVAARLIG